jgi:predicted DNA-binding transcriptional regulator YafY
MRRADRLFQIVQHLRGRRLTTAAQLAAWLKVSERTIYRDVRDLALSGVPVEGEAGVGYRLRAGFDLPPLMFSLTELEALTAGARMMEAWGGEELAQAARGALAKIAAALPADKRIAMERTRIFAPAFFIGPALGARMDQMRAAIAARQALDVDYQDVRARLTRRRIWPLALYFWGGTWTLGAWCELRGDFRTFRIDRVAEMRADGRFPDQEGRRLADFVRRMEEWT